MPVYNCRRKTHNRNAVIVNMGHFMELFLDLSVLALWPEEVNESATQQMASKGKYRLTQHHLGEDWSC